MTVDYPKRLTVRFPFLSNPFCSSVWKLSVSVVYCCDTQWAPKEARWDSWPCEPWADEALWAVSANEWATSHKNLSHLFDTHKTLGWLISVTWKVCPVAKLSRNILKVRNAIKGNQRSPSVKSVHFLLHHCDFPWLQAQLHDWNATQMYQDAAKVS